MRGLLRRTPTAALHVHVGMPDPETAIAACNRLRAYLPAAAGASRRTRRTGTGCDSGFATARAQLFRGFPRAVIPRAFAGWEDYVASVEAWVAAGDAARLHVPVVGPAAAPEARHARGARDGRPVARCAPSPASRRSCTRSPSPARDGAAAAAAARARRSSSPRSAPAATGSTRRLVGGALRPLPRGRRRRRSRSPGPYAREHGADARSTRSSASCARATAPTACAPRTRPAGCPRCSSLLVAESRRALRARRHTTSPMRSQL